MNNSWFKGLLYSVCLALMPIDGSAEQSIDRVIIVKSSDNAYFDQTIETLSGRLDRALPISVMPVDEFSQNPPNAKSTNLIVTFGEKAASAVGRLDTRAGSIFTYVTFEQYRSLMVKEGDTAILLDQPMPRYLAFCKYLLGIESLGIIEQRPLELDAGAEAILQKQQISLQQYRVDSHNKLLPVLRKLMQHEDALLMLPRQSIYNRDSLKGVLLTGYRSGKPVISYSPAHVKSGALASIYSSPIDIGRHLALLINHRLRSPSGTTPAAFEFARFYSVATNRRIARALDIPLPEQAHLREQLDRAQP